MKNFMKNFVMILVTMILTAAILVGVAVVKFGMINIDSHVDHYETTCNGVVVSRKNETVTDSIDFNIDINEGFNIFTR